ncbi:Asp-tRNA(Asn)/Glu-tRNA(Gln) amidotransferase subunit GatC [Candidatus Woesearchaeota archaeon]|nr:Asp-tRNA(Asn)/Glu-tRNA(Gln) amidotransferase subunit GatC [Candidatus Woesearchaeota archaeon]
MQIDKDILNKVATISRLKLTKEEQETFLPELKEILKAFSELTNLDTSKIELSIQPLPVSNVFREDIIKKSLEQEEALLNTKHTKNGYFKAPKVI